jgi:hypothetical protein
LAITVVHLGSFSNTALAMTAVAASCSINWLTTRLPTVVIETQCFRWSPPSWTTACQHVNYRS